MNYDETIDYSPNPSAVDMILPLYEQNLQNASSQQIERFLRVWVVDRQLYAPKLTNLTIEFHTCGRKVKECVGIQKFLSYYNSLSTPYNTILHMTTKCSHHE